jgi:hypothetical protein
VTYLLLALVFHLHWPPPSPGLLAIGCQERRPASRWRPFANRRCRAGDCAPTHQGLSLSLPVGGDRARSRVILLPNPLRGGHEAAGQPRQSGCCLRAIGARPRCGPPAQAGRRIPAERDVADRLILLAAALAVPTLQLLAGFLRPRVDRRQCSAPGCSDAEKQVF